MRNAEGAEAQSLRIYFPSAFSIHPSAFVFARSGRSLTGGYYGIANAAPVTAPAWNAAARHVNPSGSIMYGAQLPGR